MANHDLYLAKLIEELSDDKQCFKTYASLTQELLRRVHKDKVVLENDKDYAEKEDSVFDRVEQHKHNGENHLDMFAEQFQKVHGVDHKTFTENWLKEHTGKAYKLEKVMENPSFEDFVGVYDVKPKQAYVASKLIIDESDFMGVFDLSCKSCKPKTTNTYDGVQVKPELKKAPSALARGGSHEGLKVHFDEDEQAEIEKHESYKKEMHEAMKDEKHEHHDSDDEHIESQATYDHHDSKESFQVNSSATGDIACCDDASKMKPHFLGSGHYLQFRLRRENVIQYLNDSYPSRKLKGLIPDDPLEPVYVFTASSNGVMRFFPWGGTSRKLWHGYGDSTSLDDFTHNLGHAVTYGCFCFGVIYKECENYKDEATGKTRQGGRTIVMRYNRWATANSPIYAMVRQKRGHEHKEVDKEDHRKSMFTQHRDKTGFETICSCCVSRSEE